MSTTETDLIEADAALLGMISVFSESISAENRPHRKQREDLRSLPFSLTGYAEFLLEGRCELSSTSGNLVWIVRAESLANARSRPVELRYAIDASALGDIGRERARCEWRLKKLAEAHLRAHLHMLKFDLSSFSAEATFVLDEKGRLLDS